MIKSKYIILLTLTTIFSLVIFLQYRQYAFPEHQIQFQIDEKYAVQKTRELAKDVGMNTDGSIVSTVFDINNTTKTYLERELDAKQAGELAKSEANLWFFTTRIFKPNSPEELKAYYAPDGRLVGFEHTIKESEKRETVTPKKAEELAQQYLARNCQICLQTNFPARWKLVDTSTIQKSNRIDYQLIYERTGYTLKDSTQRVGVTIRGNSVEEYQEWIQIPERWRKEYNQQLSYNETTQTVAQVINTILIALPFIIVFVIKFKDKKIIFNTTTKISLIITLITLCATANSWTQYLYSLPNTQDLPSIIALAIGGISILALATYVSTFVTISAGEALYREVYPQKKNVISVLKNFFIDTSSTKAVYIGILVGILALTYQVFYYFLGKSLGFWVPAEVNYSDAFNSVAPWIYPLTVGLIPAVTEEVTYRLFGISLFKKYLRKTWIAVILSSVIWAFLHSGYPQTPFFVRGVELTLVGLAFSYIFLRYGILSSISAHYTFNALQVAIFFLNAKSYYVSISGLIIALLPLWLVCISKIVQKKSYDTEILDIKTNQQMEDIQASQTIKEEKIEEIKILSEPSLFTKRKKILLTTIVLISILAIGVTAYFQEAYNPGSSQNKLSQQENKFTTTREEAIAVAKGYLSNQGVNLTEYTPVVSLQETSLPKSTEKYLSERADSKEIQSFVDKYFIGEYWTVRFFKPLQTEEYTVKVLPSGEIYTFNHTVPETASGEDIPIEEAEKRAKTYLAEKHINIQELSKVKEDKHELKNRTDFTFLFENKQQIGDASYQIEVDVKQGKAQDFRTSITLPQEFERAQESLPMRAIIIGGVFTILGILLLSQVSSAYIDLFRNKLLNKNAAHNLAILALIFGLISQANSLATFWYSYKTEINPPIYILTNLIEIPVSLLFTYILMRLGTSGAIALYQKYIGPLAPANQAIQKKLFGQAFLLLITLGIVAIALLVVNESILKLIHSQINTCAECINGEYKSPIASPEGITSYIPVLEGLKAITRTPLIFAGIILFFTVLRRFSKSWRNALITTALVISLIIINALLEDLSSVIPILQMLPVLILILVLILYFARNNLYYYALVIYYLQLLVPMLFYLEQPNSFWIINGVGYIILAILPLIFYWKYHLFVEMLNKKWLS